MSDELVTRARAYVVHVDGNPVNLGDRIEELTRERDEAIRQRDTMFTSTADGITKLAEERDRLAAQVKEAGEVLREMKRGPTWNSLLDALLARLED